VRDAQTLRDNQYMAMHKPPDMPNRVFDATAGRLFVRRWSNQSLDALRRAAGSVAPADR